MDNKNKIVFVTNGAKTLIWDKSIDLTFKL